MQLEQVLVALAQVQVLEQVPHCWLVLVDCLVVPHFGYLALGVLGWLMLGGPGQA